MPSLSEHSLTRGVRGPFPVSSLPEPWVSRSPGPWVLSGELYGGPRIWSQVCCLPLSHLSDTAGEGMHVCTCVSPAYPSTPVFLHVALCPCTDTCMCIHSPLPGLPHRADHSSFLSTCVLPFSEAGSRAPLTLQTFASWNACSLRALPPPLHPAPATRCPSGRSRLSGWTTRSSLALARSTPREVLCPSPSHLGSHTSCCDTLLTLLGSEAWAGLLLT